MSTPQNDSFQFRCPKPADSRYLKNETVPWTSTSEVNTTILPAYRYKGLTVLIVDTEYWYHTGITDSDLVPKADTNGAISLTLSADGFYTFAQDTLAVALVVSPSAAINFKAGSSVGAEDFVPTMLLNGNQTAPIAVFLWRPAGSKIYFGGLAGATTTIFIKTL